MPTGDVSLLPPAPQENALVPVSLEALDAIERSRIDLQINAAQRHPRPPIEIIEDRIKSRATRRRDVAELCYYSLPRYDKDSGKNKLIHGASIKLANIALSEWGNTLSGARTVGNDGSVVKAYGICWDLQSNNQKFAEVQRRILDKMGRPYSYDMQIVTAQAANSIAERNAILKVLGDDLYVPILNDCMKVVAGTSETLIERRAQAVKWFSIRGVSHEQILALLERTSLDEIDQDDVAYLSGLANGIKDKVITLQEAFAPSEEESEPAHPRQKLGAKLAAARAQRRAEEEKDK